MFRHCAAVLIVLICSATLVGACSRRPVQGQAPVLVAVELRITNNLGEALDVSASSGGGLLWSGSLPANDSLRASLGTLPNDAAIALRATNVRGAVVSARNSVRVHAGTLIWIIP
jgi:hypothetical protein